MSKLEIKSLMKRFDEFNEERGWNQEPEDLAKSIVIEASELLEHFQWDNSARKLNVAGEDKDWEKIGQEVADVFLYLSRFCSITGIDLSEEVAKKMKYNAVKFPREKFKDGHNDKFYKKQKKKYRKKK